jgi:glycolate oxidase
MPDIGEGFRKRLVQIFGRENVSDEMEERICASYDATKRSALPDVVVRARNAEQICALMKLCNERLVPVYAQGACTGLVGGAVPFAGGVALDMTRMNRIIEIDRRNLTATVEPGVVTADLQKDAEKAGLFYPPDPASHEFSTLGGNVAQGAGGLQCVKYGVTREYVLALNVVLPTGELIHTGSLAVKDVTGYDLTALMVGSEGTLGIFTRMVLRLLPLPEDLVTSLCYFRDAEAAMDAVSAIIAAKIVPRAIEFMDEECARSVQGGQDLHIPDHTGAVLLIELDGKRVLIEDEMKRCVEICRSCGAFEAFEAYSAEEREKAWSMRRAISPALYKISPGGKINEDVCIPRSELTKLLHGIKEISGKHGVKIACFGHAGDGNVHVNALVDLSDEEAATRGYAAVREVFEKVISLGGTLSGEHGVGVAKQPYLAMQIPEKEMKIMRSIKKLFDPNNILNPNKIFPSQE